MGKKAPPVTRMSSPGMKRQAKREAKRARRRAERQALRAGYPEDQEIPWRFSRGWAD